jgi:ABC-type multidrug transport system ATPase subunit
MMGFFMPWEQVAMAVEESAVGGVDELKPHSQAEARPGRVTPRSNPQDAFMMALAAVLAGVHGMLTAVKLKQSKVGYLLYLNGLGEMPRLLAAITVGLLETVPSLVLVPIAATVVKSLKASDWTLVFTSFTVSTLAFQLWMAGIETFLHSETAVGVWLVIQIVLCFGVELVQMMATSVPAAVQVVLHAIFPYSGWMGLVTQGVANRAMKWAFLPRKVNGVAGATSLSMSFVNLAVMFVICALFNMCVGRPFGLAPLGWRRIFSKRHWRALFVSPKRTDFTGLRTDSLTKCYGELKAVDDMTFSVEGGECVICIGANGAGKTTLLEMLCGAREPTSGTVTACGSDVFLEPRPFHAVASIVFQDNALHPQLTAREHLEHFRKMNARDDDVVSYYSSVFHMGEFLDTFGANLSGGSKRKLCIALALVKNPQILVLDEPTAGVDVEARQNIWRALAGLTGLASFINAHSVEEAEAFASKLLVMKKGQKEFMGSPAELRAEFKCGYEVTLLGENPDAQSALALVQSVVPEAEINPEHENTLMLPADLRMSDALAALGDAHYIVHLESLETTITKLIEDEEAEVK